MVGASPFSHDYHEARGRFRAAAAARGARVEAHPIGGGDPDGQPLTIDVARLGDPSAARAVVISSGLHGVEGPFGSAVQVALLEGAPPDWSPPPGTALVLVHALNPYGFARGRRFDQSNVDLNRNFLLDGQEFRGCPPRYADLDGLLNPRHPPSWHDPFLPRAVLAILRYGFSELLQAVAGGQYEFPRGLFFGGHGPAPLQALLADRLPGWVGPAEDVLHLDFHTGLGRWAEYELMCESRIRPERRAWLAAHFGLDRVRGCEPGEVAYYDARGSLGAWCQQLFPDRSYTLLCAEFGTYHPLTVVAALRAENQAHHWGTADDLATREAKARLREVFVPADRGWREATLARGVALVRRALEASRDVPDRLQPEVGR
jgi:hypothetical protein